MFSKYFSVSQAATVFMLGYESRRCFLSLRVSQYCLGRQSTSSTLYWLRVSSSPSMVLRKYSALFSVSNFLPEPKKCEKLQQSLQV